MKKISCSTLLLIFLTAVLTAAEIRYSRTEQNIDFAGGTRKRSSQKTLFFSEFQFMYGLFQNYLHKWIDRPLFFDRETRYPDGTYSYVTESSFQKEAEITKLYGLDGIGSLANIAGGSLYDYTDKYAQKMKNFNLLEFAEYGFANDYDNFKKIIEIAKQSPYTAKINGKILIPTYGIFWENRAVPLDFIKRAKSELGDCFRLTCQLDIEVADIIKFKENPELTLELKEKYRKKFAQILSLFDGIQINPAVNMTELDGDYMCHFDTDFYNQLLLPVLEELYNRPENADKIFGNTILHGYINHMSGVNHGEFGTARLRASLESSIKSNPDYVLLFEWNEVNENTCFQPTLYNSMALQRLIRYAIARSRAEIASANPHDDLTLPNLTLSCRETLKVGEPLQFELLNIPDTVKSDSYSVKLKINDLDGKLIYEFPMEKFNRKDFKAVTFTVTTEDISKHQILLPSLVIVDAQGAETSINNFHYVHLRPTFCNVYKSVRQPIRDLLNVNKSVLTVTPEADGSFTLSGKLEADEELASLEILDNEREVAAFDRKNEFDHRKNQFFVGSFSNQRGALFPISIKVDGSKNWQFRPWHAPNVNFAYDLKRIDDKVSGNALIWAQPCNFIITVPNEEVANSTLEVTVNGKNCKFKLSELAKLGKMAKIVDSDFAIRLDMEKFEKLLDIPLAVNAKSAEININVKSDYKFPLYQLRAVSKSGKIYRSKPRLPLKVDKPTVKANVFSETQFKVQNAELISALIPVLDYKFVPEAGAMLRSGHDARFDAQLGGGFVYCEPFSADMLLPAGKLHAPEWKTEDNFNYLHFNGDYQYINFPAEAFPRGSFMLEFEIRPEKSRLPLILFRHFDPWLGSVSIYLKYDKLYFAFGDRSLKTHRFATNLNVPVNQWSNVKITYDCKNISFDVNGKIRKFPFSARALYLKPAIFGGHDKIEFGIDEKMSYFKGDLRKFIISHQVENML